MLIYHCPNNGDSLLHPNGYDICCNCAKLEQQKILRFYERKKKEEKKRDSKKKIQSKNLKQEKKDKKKR